MHEIQKRLLELSQKKLLARLTLREIGKLVGVDHPQKVKHHLNQLVKRGLIGKDYSNMKPFSAGEVEIINIPVLGSANCGEPTMLAEENLEGYLKVSPELVQTKRYQDLFALRAVGDSMNDAKVKNSHPINDGDYTIIDKSINNPTNGDYVVSIIDNSANIKKYFYDARNQLIYLSSESLKKYPPIVIKARDNFTVSGKVIEVIKNPKEVTENV